MNHKYATEVVTPDLQMLQRFIDEEYNPPQIYTPAADDVYRSVDNGFSLPLVSKPKRVDLPLIMDNLQQAWRNERTGEYYNTALWKPKCPTWLMFNPSARYW